MILDVVRLGFLTQRKGTYVKGELISFFLGSTRLDLFLVVLFSCGNGCCNQAECRHQASGFGLHACILDVFPSSRG